MGGHGSFSGNPKTEWLVDSFGRDRDMRLIEDFWYQDPDGRKWTAPAGSIVNGASIPRSLWAIVGSPYTDDYRRASIVHDVACKDPSVDHEFKLLTAELAALPEDASMQEIDALINKHFVPGPQPTWGTVVGMRPGATAG